MDAWKSQAEFYLDLCSALLVDDPYDANSRKLLDRDLLTLVSRFRAEGLSFLTKSLPKLGKALDLGLVEARFNIPRGFKAQKDGSRPAFMQAYFNLVFDESGVLRSEAPPAAVNHLRQVLFFAYKLDVPYHPDQESAVLAAFKETDDGLQLAECEEVGHMLDLASRITETVFEGFDPKDILPRHGPGAVATGERLEEKWEFSRLYSSIHQFYPYYDYFVVGGGRELLDRRDWYRRLRRLDRGVAKVVLVPKDSRGPRLISAEPLEFQWVQQGLGRKMAKHLEADQPLTRGNVNFTSQEVNRRLALSASRTGAHATLDLKDASDRVSLELVKRIFSRTPRLARALEATRTEATLLPTGELVTLKKFAPMGSALCFPVEAYVFWVIMVAAAVREARLPLKSAARSIYVYGDDIVVPTAWADRSMRALESVGLVVNRQKSCITGLFRESCGMDAFNGVQVTPTRLRHLYTDRSSDGTVLSGYSALANQLAQKGYAQTADLVWTRLEKTYGPIAYGTPLSSFPCRIVDRPESAELKNSSRFQRRYNRRYQRFEFKVLRVLPVRRDTKLDGWARLMRDIVSSPGDDPSSVVVPRSTVIKREWASVF